MTVWSAGEHIAQICAGLTMLARQGAIHLTQEISSVPSRADLVPAHLSDARDTHMRLTVDDRLTLYFDEHDAGDIDVEMAMQSDFYFKRSYTRALIPAELQSKVYPLGLNYEVNADGFDRHEIRRLLAPVMGGRARKGALRMIGRALSYRSGGIRIVESRMRAPPDYGVPPRVLFLAKAWDPAFVARGSAQLYAATEAVNETRAACIRAFREHFGDQFLGGFVYSAFAEQRYPALLLRNDRLTSKGGYINLLRGFPICVATSGLHGSIGWKLAEYVAFSKAIVTEQLNYVVPGSFGDPDNYLVFDSADNAVSAVDLLIKDRHVREVMMQSNWDYYQRFLRPDVLVMRALQTALDGTSL